MFCVVVLLQIRPILEIVIRVYIFVQVKLLIVTITIEVVEDLIGVVLKYKEYHLNMQNP